MGVASQTALGYAVVGEGVLSSWDVVLGKGPDKDGFVTGGGDDHVRVVYRSCYGGYMV